MAATTSGVPLGSHSAWLLASTTACPFAVSRVAAIRKVAVTHGPLACGGSEQPATLQTPAMVTVGWPPTITRSLAVSGCADPP